MNLVDDPWVPVLFSDGQAGNISLHELFLRAENIQDLIVNPAQRIALMKLFICIAQTALDGPEDVKEWQACKPRIAKNTIEYLRNNISLFELYGDRPFLQVPNLQRTSNASLDKLDFGLAAGNNPVLFDRAAQSEKRRWPPAWQALQLITFQVFSPGGTIGTTIWDGQKTSGKSEHSPAIVESALHTILRGRDMMTSLYLNLLTKESIRTLPQTSWGRPVWEVFPLKPNGIGVEELSKSYLGRLVPLSRAILLEMESSEFTLANGISFEKLPIHRETTATVIMKRRQNKEEPGYLALDVHKHPWRELGSIISNSNGLKGGALALQNLQFIEAEYFDIWTGGMAADKGKIIDMAEWSFNLHTTFLQSTPLSIYQSGIALALKAENTLKAAILSYCEYFNSKDTLFSSLFIKARSCYWSILDNSYTILLDSVNQGKGIDDGWGKIVHGAVLNSFDQACPRINARQIQAYALGKRRFNWWDFPSNKTDAPAKQTLSGERQ